MGAMRALFLLTWMTLLGACGAAAADAAQASPQQAQVGVTQNKKSNAGLSESGHSAVQQLAADFFAWRRDEQPISGSDLNRVERPDGWVPEWSPAALADYRQRYRDYLLAVERFDTRGWDVAARVDARLLRAAIQRVFWELEVLESPHRDPGFYVQQTLGSVFDLLLLSSPVDEARARNLLLRLEHIPATLSAARANLDRPVRPFAEAAIADLGDIDVRLGRVQVALLPAFTEELKPRLAASIAAASSALLEYRNWLESRLVSMQTAFALGPLAYQWFLINVALLPYSPNELLSIGQHGFDRAEAWSALESERNRDVPPLPLYPSQQRQVDDALLKSEEIRAFLAARDLLSVPDTLPVYRLAPLPDHLEPLAFLGVTDDLTSADRLGEDALRYLPPPGPELAFFELSAARDPRPLIIHEGVPGRYLQLAQSWSNPDPIRRHYFDSAVNEGIACYMEEMLLRAGLFDFSPRTREIVLDFSRLRALYVEVDVRLAIGDFTIDQAADYLERGGLGHDAALRTATHFAATPSQAIACEIGKTQILGFLSDARLRQGDEFSLRDFHDHLLSNGNVPIALQRWDYLGRDDEVLLLDALGGKPATVPR